MDDNRDTGGSDVEVDESIVSDGVQSPVRSEKRSRQEVSDLSEELIEEDGFKKVCRKVKRTRVNKSVRKEREGETQLVIDLQDESDKWIVSIISREILPKQFGMAKLLRAENIQNVLKISYKSPYRVFIEFTNKLDCDNLINCEKMITLGFRCQMLDEISLSYGLVRQVDLDIEEKEALENLKCDYNILSVRRLKRLAEDGKWVDSETIRLSIKGSTLPPYVFGYGCRFKVEPYTFPVSQCSGCWKFGHLSRACPAKKVVCPKCGGDHKNCETDKFTCANCKGPHMVLYKQCPVFLKEKEIRKIMCLENCTYRKAYALYFEKKEGKRYVYEMTEGRINNGEIEQEKQRSSQVLVNREDNTLSYRDILVTEAIVHRVEMESNDDSLEREDKNRKEETIGLGVEYKKSGKKKKRKPKKYPQISDEVSDHSEHEMDISQDEEKKDEEEEKPGMRSESRKSSGFRRLVKEIEKILLSERRLEEKLKSVCNLVFQEVVQYLLSLFRKEQLLNTVITFISGGSYS